jgi:hypothetical protein
MIRIRVRSPEGVLEEFTLVAIVAEEVVISGKKTIKAMAYCFNKERTPFRFFAEQIEKYER